MTSHLRCVYVKQVGNKIKHGSASWLCLQENLIYLHQVNIYIQSLVCLVLSG